MQQNKEKRQLNNSEAYINSLYNAAFNDYRNWITGYDGAIFFSANRKKLIEHESPLNTTFQ